MTKRINNNFLKRLRRMEPLSMIFWISLSFLILGILVPPLKFLATISGIVLIVYILYFLIWLKENT